MGPEMAPYEVRPRWVRKRDGRRVPFDPRKLHAALSAAAAEAGEGLLVEELCELIELFLERQFSRRLPTTDQLRALVRRVLDETNHPGTAAAYAARHERADRRRGCVRVAHSAAPPLGVDGELPSGPAEEGWNEGRISQQLQRLAGLRVEVAEEVAGAVEARIFALGLDRVSTNLVRELVQLELEARSLSTRLPDRELVAVPVQAVRRLLSAAYVRRAAEPAEPTLGAEALVGRDLLARYALGYGLPEPVAAAHQAGELHLVGLGQPLRLTSGALALDRVKAALGARAPSSAAEAAVAIADLLARADTLHSRVIGIPFANVFLAPLAHGREARARRDLREAIRILTAAAPTAQLRLHLGAVPAELENERPVGKRGKRWRSGYGDLATEAERVGRLLLEVALEERAASPLPRRPELLATVREPKDLATWREVDGLVLSGAGLRPPAAQGLAAPKALVGLDDPRPFVAGCVRVVALNCARAAREAGSGNAPAFFERLQACAARAVEACEVGLRQLELTVYRPHLPLWDVAPERTPPSAVPLEHAVCVLGLVGLEEACTLLLGESPQANPAVREFAATVVATLAREVEPAAARRGLRVRLEEPDVELGARRLAELDAGAAPFEPPLDGDPEPPATYSTGLVPSWRSETGLQSVVAAFRAAGLAPLLWRGPEREARATAPLEALAD